MILSYNNLSQINSTAFKDISRESSFSLDLSHNRIEYLTVVMFEDLVTLLDNFRVDLSENQIRFARLQVLWKSAEIPRQFGPKKNSERKPASDQNQIVTEIKIRPILLR